MHHLPEIPGYKIIKLLGEGGMASVYLGIQEKLHRKVAIKILDPVMVRNKIIAARFIQESETAANLYHSNIISIFDVGQAEGIHYIVMEYLEETLKDRLVQSPGRRLPPDMALDIVKKIMSALDYAHSEGIIHRDIKPDNIMFRKDGTPVLVDFGIARVMDTKDQMTKSGVSLGTPYYMSPEQCNGEPIKSQSDIYSLGVVLFELLTGTKPYLGDTPVAIALKQVKEPIPQLPPSLKRYQPILNTMMTKAPENRLNSSQEFEQLLDRIRYEDLDATQHTVPVTKAYPATQQSQAPSLNKTTTFSEMLGRKYSIKSIVGILIAGSALLVIFFIFFNMGKGKSPKLNEGAMDTPLSVQSPKSSSQSALTAEKRSENSYDEETYKDNYYLAERFVYNGDYDKALKLIEALKAIKASPQILELEERVRRDMQILEDNRFQELMTMALEKYREKNYEEARKMIELAKKIRSTPQLIELEEKIKNLSKEKH